MTRFDGRSTVTPASPHMHMPVGERGRATPAPSAVSPLRKAAILIVSLDQPLASQVLAQLDRSVVEMVTLEIARLDRIAPEEQQAVHEEFLDLGLRRLRFAFDDIAAMKDADICMAYHDEDAPTWALALAGAPRPVRDKVLGALPRANAETLQRTLEGLGPFRLDDTEAAQAELAEQLRRLHDHGRLTLPDTGSQEEILA
jgi:flagellar motor switch protein FliG